MQTVVRRKNCGRKLVVLGAECTGKTSLCLALAAQRAGVVVAEVLRDFCAHAGRTPTAAEQYLIFQTQIEQEASALRQAGPQGWVWCDSGPLMTALYSQIYFADAGLMPEALRHQSSYAACLVMAPDLGWQADGIQRDGPAMQQTAHQALLDLLRQHQLPHHVISGQALLRQAAAQAQIAAITGLESAP